MSGLLVPSVVRTSEFLRIGGVFNGDDGVDFGVGVANGSRGVPGLTLI